MSESISVPLDKVLGALDRLRAKGLSQAYTTDVIAEYMGGFHSNLGVPPQYSWNAQFGKVLKANEAGLRIKELSAANPVEVAGHQTRASLWALRVDG